MSFASTAAQLWAKADRPGVRAFALSIAALTVALLLALYSSAAAELGHVILASVSALAALAVAAWVAVTLVPVLAKRTPLRWMSYSMEFKITREGWIYVLGILLVAIAALNTGNNLLFLILASLIATILMSGILSSITLSGVEPVAALLETPVYFPYVAKHDRAQQSVPMIFPRRGTFRQEAFRIATRFPFGFLKKSRRVDLKTEALVYPSVEPTQEFLEILPGLEGALESLAKGRGQDLYALRDYVATDSARHVHWKASARSGSLMVREFTREDDCRILLVLDPHVSSADGAAERQKSAARFDRAVTLCAAVAWHFYERNALLQFRSAGVDTSLQPAGEVIFPILRHLALAQPLPPDPAHLLITELAAGPDLFKIIVTGQPRGSIPAGLWHTSYVIFVDDLAK